MDLLSSAVCAGDAARMESTIALSEEGWEEQRNHGRTVLHPNLNRPLTRTITNRQCVDKYTRSSKIGTWGVST